MAQLLKTPILGSASKVRSPNADGARMINLFPEITMEGGKEPAYLTRAPGLIELADIGTGPVRGLWQYGGYLYVASGTQLYKVDTSYNATLLGTITGTGPVSMADNGTQLFIACNPNGYIYNANTNVFAQITDPDFPGAQQVGYLDGFFVFNEPNSQKFWVTALLDGTSIDPLDFASAEGFPDDVVSLIVDHRELWLLGTTTTEVWYNAGGLDFPFERIPGAFNEVGCIASYSVAKMDNQIYWLGQDARGYGVVYRANGYIAQRVSTHAVEYALQKLPNLSEVIGFTYQQAGHTFYWMATPDYAFSWVFDVATGAWTERAGFNPANGAWVRHRANCQVAFNGKIIVGDYENGKIYDLSLYAYDDNGTPQKWLRSWRALATGQNNLTRTAHHMMQLDCETGTTSVPANTEVTIGSEGPDQFGYSLNFYGAPVGSITNNIFTPLGGVIDTLFWDATLSPAPALYMALQGIYPNSGWTQIIIGNTPWTRESADYAVTSFGGNDYTVWLWETPDNPLGTSGTVPVWYETAEARVMLRWSDDGGHTYSNEHWASLGSAGEYSTRVIWRRLGMTMKLRDRLYEVSGIDPGQVNIMGAELLISPTAA